jgi:hypothetical protein
MLYYLSHQFSYAAQEDKGRKNTSFSSSFLLKEH